MLIIYCRSSIFISARVTVWKNQSCRVRRAEMLPKGSSLMTQRFEHHICKSFICRNTVKMYPNGVQNVSKIGNFVFSSAFLCVLLIERFFFYLLVWCIDFFCVCYVFFSLKKFGIAKVFQNSSLFFVFNITAGCSIQSNVVV